MTCLNFAVVILVTRLETRQCKSHHFQNGETCTALKNLLREAFCMSWQNLERSYDFDSIIGSNYFPPSRHFPPESESLVSIDQSLSAQKDKSN